MPDNLSSNPSDLLAAARHSGEAGELLRFYRSYLKVLARIQLGRHLQAKTDSSDVVQEVCLKAAQGFLEFRGSTEQELLAWLRQILARVIANAVRHYLGTQGRDLRLEESLDQDLAGSTAAMRSFAANDPSPSEHAIQREQAVLLTNALESLPDDYRQVVLLRHIEQLSFPEISRRMGRSIHSVKNIWPRALTKLKLAMEAQR